MTSRDELIRELVMDGLSERSAQLLADRMSRSAGSFYVLGSAWPTRAVFGGLAIPWLLDVSTDPSIKVDDSDPTLLHFPAGAWLGFLQVGWRSGTATSVNSKLLLESSGDSSVPAGDGTPMITSVSYDPHEVYGIGLFFFDEPGTQRFTLSSSDASGSERFSGGGIDLVRVSV